MMEESVIAPAPPKLSLADLRRAAAERRKAG